MAERDQRVANRRTSEQSKVAGKATDRANSAMDREKAMGGELPTSPSDQGDMPQMKAGESPAAYGARVRKWREAKKSGQKAALK